MTSKKDIELKLSWQTLWSAIALSFAAVMLVLANMFAVFQVWLPYSDGSWAAVLAQSSGVGMLYVAAMFYAIATLLVLVAGYLGRKKPPSGRGSVRKKSGAKLVRLAHPWRWMVAIPLAGLAIALIAVWVPWVAIPLAIAAVPATLMLVILSPGDGTGTM